MLALRDLQLRFADALFDGAVDRIQTHIEEDGVASAARIAIYRNNLREGFIRALALGFPVIERLVGEDYFRHLALDFLKSHPSRAGNLHHIGAPLAGCLRKRFEQTEYTYLADIAALEWAHQEALVATDAPAIQADALQSVDPTQYCVLHFDLHAAVRLVQSNYPIIQIWRANRPDAAATETIDLGSGGDNVLVLRTPECVELHRIRAGDFAFLLALSQDENLGAALEGAQAADVEFDLGAALRRSLSLNLFTGLRLPDVRHLRTRS
ncbi:MAG: DNA-binding domain-containing protein [Gammaproteobacteria bacterium]